ncbi:hypothetical protein P261_02763 [Lachnospiraceae bacterium TWA4]|nr:hypothetical protein P261_02763 [Lachnospiraceae bacterium TWA4]
MAKIIEITDFNEKALDIYARKSEGELLNRHEPEKGIFIAESPKVIERALNSGCKPISILMEKKHINGQGQEILKRCKDVPVYVAEFDILTQLTGFKLTRGMLCAMHRPAPKTFDEVCASAKRIVILENIMNPTNVGAIFRSAAALNMDSVILTYDCSNPLYRRAIRVSMGTVFQIPWMILDKDVWPEQAIKTLHEKGFKTAALALSNDSVPIDDPNLMNEEKIALIFGSEGDGLTTKTITDCDYTVKIPMSHDVDSLNVAAASAVACWQIGCVSRKNN